MVFAFGEFPKVHDLTHLLKLCAKKDKKFIKFSDNTDFLGQYYLVSRYPLTEYSPAGKKEAKKALNDAKEILDFVRSQI